MTAINTNIESYKFYIHPEVINNMYNLMIDGNNEQFIENGAPTQGTERGGHFCYKKNDDKLSIEIIGLIQSGLMPGTTSLNSGDFPFTFHTHPIVIKLGDALNQPSIDNYPNVISDDDLIGSIEDNYYYNHQTSRSICNKFEPQQTGGINFFDVLASPYGLFVYRPIKNNIITTKPINIIEDECDAILQKSITLLPIYTVRNSAKYFNITTVTAIKSITNYLQLLKTSGFNVDFFPWSGAITNGILFKNELPSQSPIDNICMC
jgi:hypothetical protein